MLFFSRRQQKCIVLSMMRRTSELANRMHSKCVSAPLSLSIVVTALPDGKGLVMRVHI